MKIIIENQQKKYSKESLEAFNDNINASAEAFCASDFIDADLFMYLKNAYVTLTYVGEAKMKKTNSETRGIDKVTDVLSFPMLEMKEGKLLRPIDINELEFESEGNRVLNLGDILICPEIAYKHSLEYGHSFEREISFLVIHSLLHLAGFDHIDSNDEKQMIFWQRKLLSDIGLAFDEEIEFVSHANEVATPKKVLDDHIINRAGSLCGHCGYVALIGRPNVGKSTLINYLSGMKLAIVSHKPQTTRTNIRYIYNGEDSQIIFVDTPGVHKPGSELAKIMVENSFNSARHADLVLLIADGRFDKPASVEKELIKRCRENGKRVILAINKADEVSKESLLPIIKSYSEYYDFEEIIPISAKEGENVDLLLGELEKRLPSGPRLFDSEEMTDQTEREIAAELIREQLLHYTNQEIPHGIAVVIDKFEEKLKENATDEYDRELVVIHATIVCERKSHRAIILGKDGQMIKRIGTKARIGIERLTGCKVYLDLFVKIREDWKNDSGYLKQYGYYVEED